MMQEIIDILNKATTREEGMEALKDLKGKDLHQVAKHFDVYVGGVKVKDLPEKIVESTIGARLRSQAIRNTSIK